MFSEHSGLGECDMAAIEGVEDVGSLVHKLGWGEGLTRVWSIAGYGGGVWRIFRRAAWHDGQGH